MYPCSGRLLALPPELLLVWKLVENQKLGQELHLCLLKEKGVSEETVDQPVTWGWWMQVRW